MPRRRQAVGVLESRLTCPGQPDSRVSRTRTGQAQRQTVLRPSGSARRQRACAQFGDYVSRDSSHSAPNTHDRADIRPLSQPLSKSSQPRFSRPYFSSIRAAASEAILNMAASSSDRGSSPLSTLCRQILMPVPPDLVPQLVVAAKDLLVVTTQEKWPDVTGAVLVGNPFNLVAVFRVPDSMAIRPDLCRISGISCLGLIAMQPPASRVKPCKLTVQLLDLSHQIRVEPSNRDARLAEA